MVGAGLPSLPKLAGDAKSYAERLFTFPTIGALSDPAARLALVEPAAEEGVSYTVDALDQMLRHSGRYPYFLQQYRKHAWLTGTNNVIDGGAVARAHELVLSVLDTDFFHVRFERATPAEQRYLTAAMAVLGDGPQRSGDVTRQLGYVDATETGPVRDSLIKKELVQPAPRSRRLHGSVVCRLHAPAAPSGRAGTRAMSTQNGPVQRLWNYCNVLRDDGLSYGDYVEQLTFLLFLKMADEQTRPPFNRDADRPEGTTGRSLLDADGDELEVHYRHMLRSSASEQGMLGVIFRKAQNKIQDPAKLRRLIVDLIDKETVVDARAPT